MSFFAEASHTGSMPLGPVMSIRPDPSTLSAEQIRKMSWERDTCQISNNLPLTLLRFSRFQVVQDFRAVVALKPPSFSRFQVRRVQRRTPIDWLLN